MRYYELTVSDPDGGQDYVLDMNGLGLVKGSGPLASSLYTTATSGGNQQLVGTVNPNALCVEFDIPVTLMHEPQGGAWLRVWGIGLRAVGQAADLNSVNGKFKKFVLKGGMSKGLPLAKPEQAGIIAQGNVFQAFGNWSGTNQTLDLILQASVPDPPSDGSGIKWEWKKGQAIADAISQTLSQALPDYTAKVNVSQNLLAPNDQPGWYPNFSSWAAAVHDYTLSLGQQLFGKDYQGVQIGVSGKTVNVFDGQGPTKPEPIALYFEDIIGQPTWISPAEITWQAVMRSKIDIQDQVKFPSGIQPPFALTTPDAAYPNTPAASRIAFQGAFVVNEIHHFANFRQADVAAWNTTFKAFVVPAAA